MTCRHAPRARPMAMCANWSALGDLGGEGGLVIEDWVSSCRVLFPIILLRISQLV